MELIASFLARLDQKGKSESRGSDGTGTGSLESEVVGSVALGERVITNG